MRYNWNNMERTRRPSVGNALRTRSALPAPHPCGGTDLFRPILRGTKILAPFYRHPDKSLENI
jgi:hypothetical protein